MMPNVAWLPEPKLPPAAASALPRGPALVVVLYEEPPLLLRVKVRRWVDEPLAPPIAQARWWPALDWLCGPSDNDNPPRRRR